MTEVPFFGDSFPLPYGTKGLEVLGGYTVYQPTDNRMFVKCTLRRIHKEWGAGIEGGGIIHWNNGPWILLITVTCGPTDAPDHRLWPSWRR